MTTRTHRPAAGETIEMEIGDWAVIQQFTGIDLSALSDDDVEHLTDEERPAIIIGGDVVIDGDASSADLVKGLTSDATVVVLGNLTVTGALDVVQNAQLVVAGSITARTIRGASANLIVKGAIDVSELACFEVSDEGGIVFCAVIRAPLVVRLGHGLDVEAPIEGEVAADVDDDTKAALTRAAAALLREPEAGYSIALYVQVRRLMQAGRAVDFVQAFRAERAGTPTAVDVPKAAPKTAVPFYGCQEQGLLLCGVAVSDERIFIAGGWGRSAALLSDNGGRTFRTLQVPIAAGLRGFFVDADALYVAGERGTVLRSTDGGDTFEEALTGETLCVNTVMRSDAAVWASGDFGAYRRAGAETPPPAAGRGRGRGRAKKGGDEEPWSKVDVDGAVSRPQDSAFGALLPTSKGFLYLSRRGTIHKTPLDAGAPLWAATATPAGTILVVGNAGGIYRSTDGGETFGKVQSGVRGSLENVACTSAGLIVVVGENGVILRSHDDGASFVRVEHDHTSGWLFGAAAFGDQVLVAGADGVLLTVG